MGYAFFILYSGRTHSVSINSLSVHKMEGCFAIVEAFICNSGSLIFNSGRVFCYSGTDFCCKLLMPKALTLIFSSLSILLGDLLVLFFWRLLDITYELLAALASHVLKIILPKTKKVHFTVLSRTMIAFRRRIISFVLSSFLPVRLRFSFEQRISPSTS